MIHVTTEKFDIDSLGLLICAPVVAAVLMLGLFKTEPNLNGKGAGKNLWQF